MKVTTTATYPASPEQIMEIITEEEFQEEKCRRTYAREYEASVNISTSRTLIMTQRAMPTDDLPDIAKGFVGDRFTIHETQAWTGPDAQGRYVADIKLHVQGAPMTGSGRRTLTPGSGGTRDDIEVSISASIPLIGRRIEQMAAPMVSAAAEIETELIAERTAN
ncbi:MAG: DUF2505 domain-containing protein [Actinomycetia bacterium]|nr:DUF2505 domain-containing protein [Actinomycetes bacterium]